MELLSKMLANLLLTRMRTITRKDRMKTLRKSHWMRMKSKMLIMSNKEMKKMRMKKYRMKRKRLMINKMMSQMLPKMLKFKRLKKTVTTKKNKFQMMVMMFRKLQRSQHINQRKYCHNL